MKVIRTAPLLEHLGVSRATLWRWIRDGQFPKPIRLGANSVAFLADEVEAWVKARADAREAAR